MELVKTDFWDRVLREEGTWQVVVLIPKGVSDYCGIGLMEVVWKAVVVILNLCFTASTTYHDSIHRFWAGRGMGTATLKVKLLQQVTDMR